MLPMKKVVLLMALAFGVLSSVGCVNEDGHFRPPDPLGRALFDLFDPPSHSRDRQYIQPTAAPTPTRPPQSRDVDYISAPLRTTQQNSPVQQNGQVWVDGAWGWNNGNRVWIPGHWSQQAAPIGSY